MYLQRVGNDVDLSNLASIFDLFLCYNKLCKTTIIPLSMLATFLVETIQAIKTYSVYWRISGLYTDEVLGTPTGQDRLFCEP